MDLVRARKKAKEKAAKGKVPRAGSEEAAGVPPLAVPVARGSGPETVPEAEDRRSLPRPPEKGETSGEREDNEEFLALAEEELSQQQREEALVEEGEVYELLGFTLGQEEYGIEIHWVEEIIRPRHLTEVPRAPGFISGVISLRGNIIPVVELRRRLGLASGGNGKGYQKIVVVTDPETRQLFGLLVEEVTEVIRLPVRELEPAPPTLGGEIAFIVGVGWVEKRMIIMLTVEELLRFGLSRGGGES